MPSPTPTSVIKVEGPDSGKAGEAVLLDVYFVVANGCGQFGSFGTTVQDSATIVAVYPVYIGEVCTLNLPTRKAVYSYTPTTKGKHTLKFWQGTNNYLIKTITVE